MPKLQFGKPEHIRLARLQNEEECTGVYSSEYELKNGYLYYGWDIVSCGVWRNGRFLMEADYDEYEDPDTEYNIIVRTFEYLKDSPWKLRTKIDDIIHCPLISNYA